MTQATSETAAKSLIDNTPLVIDRINEFSKVVLSTRGGRIGSGMGTLLESLWGFYVNEQLKAEAAEIEIGWLADNEYNDFACILRDAKWEPATKTGELLRVEAKSMNRDADESKGHFDELQRNLGEWDLLLVLIWNWESLDGIRVYPRIRDGYIGRALTIAALRDALHVARGGKFVSESECPDGCTSFPCKHAGEPLNANGKRERLSGPESCRVSNAVSHAANFGGLVRMMKTNSPGARAAFRKLRAEEQTAHDFISFLHRNYQGEEESSYLAVDWFAVAAAMGLSPKRGTSVTEVMKVVREGDPKYMERLRALYGPPAAAAVEAMAASSPTEPGPTKA